MGVIPIDTNTNMPIHMVQVRHPRGVLIGDLVSKK
jgi:hypothetical protein